MAATIARNSTLSAQDALNAMAFGIAGLRATDIAITDAKGTTLALSNTDAAKAIPSGVRGAVFWCATAFRYRFDIAADTTDGAYADANDKQIVSFDPAGQSSPATLHAILPASTDTLYVNWLYGN
jgi:hypothetical protein